MSKLLRSRWLRWSLFVAALVSLGVGIYQIQPPEPMCEIETGDVEPVRFLAGGRIATLRRRSHGLLQIWDVNSGREIARHFTGDQEDNDFVIRLSPDGEVTVRTHRGTDNHELEIYETITGKLLHRHSTGHSQFRVEFVDHMVFYHFAKADDQMQLEIWDARARKVLHVLEGVRYGPVLGPDGKRFILSRPDQDGKLASQWTVWDSASGQTIAQVPLNLEGPAALSQDGRWIAGTARAQPRIELCDLETGALLGFSTQMVVKDLAFSPDGRLLVAYTTQPAESLVLLEVPTMTPRWTKPGQKRFGKTFFSPDSDTIYTQQDEWNAQHIDCRSGDSYSYGGRPRCCALIIGQSTDGRRTFLGREETKEDRLSAWMHWVRSIPGLERFLAEEDLFELSVIDADTRQKRYRHFSHFNLVSMPLLSNDGRWMAAVHSEDEHFVLRCWEVDAVKPLRWAVSVPAGFGGAVFLIWKWRHRRANAAKT
jgi:hypothetical protein